jgi:hypothetical protein
MMHIEVTYRLYLTTLCNKEIQTTNNHAPTCSTNGKYKELTLGSKVLIEKLIVAQLFKKFLAFYEIRVYRSSRVRFPAGTGNFSLHCRVQNGSGAHPASYPMGTRGSFPGVKRSGREADHSHPSSAEVKE